MKPVIPSDAAALPVAVRGPPPAAEEPSLHDEILTRLRDYIV